jgi:hypothetical protein
MFPKDKSGSAAVEFSFIVWPFFALIFAMFDLGHYMVAQQSLNTLASEVARSMIISCGTANTTSPGQLSSSCTNPLSSTNYIAIAPLLFVGQWQPTVVVSGASSAGGSGGSFTVIASLNGFDTVLPASWWGSLVGSLTSSTTLNY